MSPLDAGAYNTTLAAAVEDILREGYHSPEQINLWLKRLREAARRSLISDAAADIAARQALEQIYDRLITKGRISDYVPNVPRYTLAMVRPRLRAELDRRILASADLIKLNRDAAIEKTLQRFSGWATSIPIGGGVSEDTRREIKADIGKSVAQVKYEARRVAIDQGHKLIANVADIVAVANGAIACIWHSHWRQAGYNYRQDHKERDGEVYAIRGSWALEGGLMKRGSAGYLDRITQPGQEPFCRCYVQYLSSLRDLPDDMLTKKGRASLNNSQAA